MITEIIKSIIFGIVQGITEWLPISSTGHLILMNSFLPLNLYSDAASNEAFWNMFKVVIQFGSILAVLMIYWNRLNPFNKSLTEKKKRSIYRLWIKIIIACVPAGVAGILLDEDIFGIFVTHGVTSLKLLLPHHLSVSQKDHFLLFFFHVPSNCSDMAKASHTVRGLNNHSMVG